MNKAALVAQLIKHEGKRNLPYEDSEGVLTIGIGHNLDVPLSDQAIQHILEDDIQTAICELDRAFFGWRGYCRGNDVRENVLIEMMFNLGAPRLATFHKFWGAMKAHDYEVASKEMLDSKWAVQVGQRARTMAEQMRTGE